MPVIGFSVEERILPRASLLPLIVFVLWGHHGRISADSKVKSHCKKLRTSDLYLLQDADERELPIRDQVRGEQACQQKKQLLSDVSTPSSSPSQHWHNVGTVLQTKYIRLYMLQVGPLAPNVCQAS